MDELYRLSEAAAQLGVHPVTLRKWSDEGLIQAIRVGKRAERRFPASELRRLRQEQNAAGTVLYGRVSGYGQRADLERQLALLRTWAQEHHPASSLHEIQDIGSGLNPHRKGLARLLGLVQQRQVQRVVITYRERLARFGFEYLAQFCESYGVELIVLHAQEEAAPEQELVEDLLAIVTSFAGRLYGRRSGKAKQLIACIEHSTSS